MQLSIQVRFGLVAGGSDFMPPHTLETTFYLPKKWTGQQETTRFKNHDNRYSLKVRQEASGGIWGRHKWPHSFWIE